MKIKIILRIIVDVLLAFSIFNGWWTLSLVIGVLSIWYFRTFIEIIVAGVAYDSLFGMTPGMGVWGYAGTIVATILFLLETLLRQVVRR